MRYVQVRNRSGLLVTTGEFAMVDFEETMELALKCKPSPSKAIRFYWSTDVQLWFLGAFNGVTEAAVVSGSGHTAAQALEGLHASATAYLEREKGVKAGELPVDPATRRALAANAQAHADLTSFLGKR